jgi:hypothetical protein
LADFSVLVFCHPGLYNLSTTPDTIYDAVEFFMMLESQKSGLFLSSRKEHTQHALLVSVAPTFKKDLDFSTLLENPLKKELFGHA